MQVKSPTEWLKTQYFSKYEIVDPTGWSEEFERFEDDKPFEPKDFNEEISLNEFMIRFMWSQTKTRK